MEGSRGRRCQFPLLFGVIVTALAIAIVNSIFRGVGDFGKMFRAMDTADMMILPTGLSKFVETKISSRADSAVETETSSLEELTQEELKESEAMDEPNAEQVKEESPKKQVKEQPKKEEQPEAKDETKPLNIVLLYGDDWRHDSIGSAKASIVRTPFFDWMATKGIKFVHNCVTTSVCWISRATLYTGLYVSRHKSDYPHKPLWYSGWADAWPKLLRDKGYYLAHIGKWHFNWEKLVYETFDYAKAYYGDHWYEERGGRIHTTKKNEQDALEFLKKRDKSKPFMMSVCFFAPHSVDGTDEQYFPQNETMSLYEDETVEVPVSATWDALKKLPWFFTDRNEARRRWGIRFDTPEKHQRMMKNYFRLITEIDQTSQVIYKELEAQGVADNTMIIFTTDNGLFHSEHQLAGKWYPHQESIRVPLIIMDPRIPKDKAGTVNKDFTLNIDLASTILGAAGIKQPSVMQGRDIADLYLTSDPKWRDEFFYEHPMHLETSIIPASTALVRKKYKFMTWPEFNVEQLFDLENDPYELDDIINSTEHEAVVAEMRERHRLLKEAALEPGPIDDWNKKATK